jgi:hypothetical protein
MQKLIALFVVMFSLCLVTSVTQAEPPVQQSVQQVTQLDLTPDQISCFGFCAMPGSNAFLTCAVRQTGSPENCRKCLRAVSAGCESCAVKNRCSTDASTIQYNCALSTDMCGN